MRLLYRCDEKTGRECIGLVYFRSESVDPQQLLACIDVFSSAHVHTYGYWFKHIVLRGSPIPVSGILALFAKKMRCSQGYVSSLGNDYRLIVVRYRFAKASLSVRTLNSNDWLGKLLSLRA